MHSLSTSTYSPLGGTISDNHGMFELEETSEVVGHPHHFMNEDIGRPERESNFSEVTQLIETKVPLKPWASQLTM